MSPGAGDSVAMPKMALVARLAVQIAPPLLIGNVGGGIREVIPITGGSFEGPDFSGIILPGGADWCLTRPDGVSEIWARYTLETDDGVLVSVINGGQVRMNAAGDYIGRTVPQFEVAEGRYGWLRDGPFLGTLLTNGAGTLAEAAFYRLL